MNKILGIDVGGTYTRYGVLINKSAKDIHKVYSKDITDFVGFVAKLIKEDPEIYTISIGIPGIVKDNVIISIPNYKPIEIPNLAEQITKETKRKVIINKDVNLLFANDIDRLNLNHHANILGFYLGTGLGNAIRIDGKTLKGDNGFAGELGHIPVIGNKLVCGCGSVGCLETIVSGRALIRIFNEQHLDGELSHVFLKHLDNNAIKEFIENFAKAIATEVNILDSTALIIGGGVANMEGFPKEVLRALISKGLRSNTLENKLEIYFVDDNPINGVIGASLIIER